MVRNELDLDVELCSVFWVSSCDVCQGVSRVKVFDLLFLDQYILLMEVCMKSDSQQFIFIPLLLVFNISMVSSAFLYACLI